MVTPRKLTDDLSVGAQITPAEVPELKALGFRSILSNRPDGEEPGQPDFAEIERAARANGLEVRHVPAVSGRLSEDDAEAFAKATRELPGPVFAHCRSGTRSTMLWAIGQAGETPVEDIAGTAARAGYDITGIVPLLEDRAKRKG